MNTIFKFLNTMFFIFFMLLNSFSQDFNTNASLTFINHKTPKSPESTSFEKYTTIPVDASTGIPKIEVPLFEISGHTLSESVGLSYHASGIKVSQEATWVGLGWDLMLGGRITLDIKGGYDKYVNQFMTAEMIATLKFLFTRFGSDITYNKIIDGKNPCNWTAETTYNWVHYGAPAPCDNFNVDSLRGTSFAEEQTKIARYGIGQPDVFHVSLNGISFSFYKDLFTDSIIIKGERNLYKVEEVSLSVGSSYYIITLTNGIKYYFQQEEKTTYIPNLEGLIPSITTSWLLTSIQHPNGDNISFQYENFGKIFTAPQISESLTVTDYRPNDGDFYKVSSNRTTVIEGSSHQTIYQHPQYLKKIITSKEVIDFYLSDRIDISGEGVKKLDKIIIKNKLTSEVLKQVQFNYSHFNNSPPGPSYFSHSLFDFGSEDPERSPINHLNLRLKLNSVFTYLNDTLHRAEYKFYYNPLQLPNKASLSQDHWGYYNGINNVFRNDPAAYFTPTLNSLIEEGILKSTNVLVNGTAGDVHSMYNVNLTTKLSGYANRKANSMYITACMLDSIVYPSGGSTNFDFEPHQSYVSNIDTTVTGGGLRIKQINDYSANGMLANKRSFTYKHIDNSTSGIYLGNIDYIQIRNILKEYVIHGSNNESTTLNHFKQYYAPSYTLFSNGNLNEDYANVKYTRVIEETGNGFIEKRYDTYYPYDIPLIKTDGLPLISNKHLYIPPTPNAYAHGRLIQESYYSQINEIRMQKEYFYSSPTEQERMSTIKISDYFVGHPESIVYQKPFIYIFEPSISWKSIPDSVIEYQYSYGQGRIKNKTSYIYNQYYQPEYMVFLSSIGNEKIIYTKTPLSYNNLTPGNTHLQLSAYSLSNMLKNNIVDVPVEKLILKKSSINGDTSIINGAYNVYDPIGNPLATYRLNSNVQIPIMQFQKSSFDLNSNDMLKDLRYELAEQAVYGGKDMYYTGMGYKLGSGPMIKEMITTQNTSSFLYDSVQNLMLAFICGAGYADVAYTSFENSGKGNWLYSGNIAYDPTSPTGSKCYILNAESSISGNINPMKEYTLSFWLKNGGQTNITSQASGTIGAQLNGWTYYEYKIKNQNTIILSGDAFIDEIKLHPLESQIKTYTYNDLQQLICETDSRGDIIYYTYDIAGRLSNVRNSERKILKNYKYKYYYDKVNFDGYYYHSNIIDGTFTKNNCPAGQPESVIYIIPEGKYKSTISQADADQQALFDLNTNGQIYANNNARCAFMSISVSGYFNRTDCPENASYVQQNIAYTVPAGKYKSFISQQDANQKAQNDLNQNGQIYANTNGICDTAYAISFSIINLPEDFTIEIRKPQNGFYKNYNVTSAGFLDYIPSGTYSIRLNPVNYTKAYNYIINGVRYNSDEHEISKVVDGLTLMTDINISIEEL